MLHVNAPCNTARPPHSTHCWSTPSYLRPACIASSGPRTRAPSSAAGVAASTSEPASIHPQQPPLQLEQAGHSKCQTGHICSQQLSRAGLLRGAAGALLLVGALPRQEAYAAGVACPGMRGYALQKCLQEQRKQREAAGGDEGDPPGKYEQPGELVTLPSGLQYREISTGVGAQAVVGSVCDIMYTVYRLSSGGYYKYSSGGTPVYMWSVGYGKEGKDDIGETYRFRLGDASALPRAVAAAVVGMQPGGRRRVLVPPQLGWTSDEVGPRPPNFGAGRRLAAHQNEALLFEAEMVRVRDPQLVAPEEVDALSQLQLRRGLPFRLPAPPVPYQQQPQEQS